MISQLKDPEISELISETVRNLNEKNSSLAANLSGSIFNKNGRLQIISMLDSYYNEIIELHRLLPKEFELGVDPDLLGRIDALSSMYIYVDKFRPQMPWSIFPSRRRMRKQFNDEMDQRLLLSVTVLKMVRSYLRLAH